MIVIVPFVQIGVLAVRRLPWLFLVAAVIAVFQPAEAAATTIGELRGNCMACHVTPGGSFRYPVISSAELDLLRVLLIVPGSLLFLYGLNRYIARWTRGGQQLPLNNIGARLWNFIRVGLLQTRVLRERRGGIIHLLIYLGAVLLAVAGIIYVIDAPVTRYPGGIVFTIFRILVNFGGLLLLVGAVAAGIRRALGLTPGLPNGLEDSLVLLWLAIIVITGMVLDAMTATAHLSVTGIPWWDFSGKLLSQALEDLTPAGFLSLYRVTQVVHLAVSVLLLATIPGTKLAHIVVSGFFNTFYARLEHPASFKAIPDVEKLVEEGRTFGVVTLADTTWKQRMDYDACTRCARCHNACPAVATGKPLSPMNLVLKLREAMRQEKWNEELVPAHVEPDVLWSCATCGACVYNCPVLIHHVETVLDLRRGLVSRGEHMPDELLQVSYNLMRTGNPYGANPVEKEEWLNSLIERGLVEEAKENKEYDYLLWVGCAAAYDPRLRGTIEALLKVLKHAGVKVAVSLEQQCCGEPARRIGDELMFVELVKQNAELLSRFRFKQLLVTCPHGFSVFRHEYPGYGVRVEVVHHSMLLARLLQKGKVKPRTRLQVKATYHDPCYLGRWNGVYEEPRRVLSDTVEKVVEMPRSRWRSFCCGGGGGGVFYDIKIGKRMSRVRVEEAASTKAQVLAVACPFCNTMLAAEAPEYGMEVKDISELLAESLSEENSSPSGGT